MCLKMCVCVRVCVCEGVRVYVGVCVETISKMCCSQVTSFAPMKID